MSGRSKFSPYRIPTQGVTGSGSGWTLLAFLFSTGTCSLLLLPLGSSSTLALLALAEFLVASMGLWMWECLNPALSVHPSLSAFFFFFVLAGLVLLGFSPRDLLDFSEKPLSTPHDSKILLRNYFHFFTFLVNPS